MSYPKKKILASIIVVNYNNAKYLTKCLGSIFNQSYKFKEIIAVDNNSNDNSLEILKKFKKKIKIVLNKKRTKEGSYNQIDSYYKGFLKSKGEIIFFLDSDDYFKKHKIKTIIEEFQKSNSQVIFDLPIWKFKYKEIKKKIIQKKFIFSIWPRFSPQSCISVKRNLMINLFKYLNIKKYETIWFDFRIASYIFLKFKKINILNEHLTFYRQLENSASKKYKLFSKNWWYRRNQAHDFISFLIKKLKLQNKLTPDKIITKFVNHIVK